jgi:hypothetical protein
VYETLIHRSLTSHCGFADAAINHSVAFVNHRAVVNDIDGLVLISILNSQIGSIGVAFLFCLVLFWLQQPVANVGMVPQLAVWAKFCSHIISQMIEPSRRSLDWTDFLLSFGSDSGISSIHMQPIVLVHLIVEIILYAIIAYVVMRTTMSYLHKFYKLGSDPMGIQSSSKTPNKNKNIKVSSESSSGNVSTASGNSSFDAASYFSPSNVILSSIKRFNASAAKSGHSDPAIEPTK